MTQHSAEAAIGSLGPPRQTGPIVLGTEFGPVSAAAERVAIRHAVRAGVPLVIVHAIDPGRLRLPGGRFRERVDQARAARQAQATALLERARASGVEPQLLIWDGDPATCVVEAAMAEGASRIVVGSHGRGLIGRVLVGSVSATIANQADCPVDIVRGDAAADDIVTISPLRARG
jgi:nucleotide-binding universal stress UspA family protein